MKLFQNSDDSICRRVREQLSDYTDNTLSARYVWEVEKHLAVCGACAAEARQLQEVVQLVRGVPRFDTANDFMASLHARLDTIDPGTASTASAWSRVRGWLSLTGDAVYRSRVPALSIGLAAVAFMLVLSTNRTDPPTVAANPPAASAESVHVSVAASGNSLFSDPAADNLEFRSSAIDVRRTRSF